MVSRFPRHTNFIYSSMFFAAGGLIYLYREMIIKAVELKWFIFTLSVAVTIVYFAISSTVFILLVLFSLFSILGILGGNIAKAIFQNKILRFISGVSMEIYLCHMFVFRALEKLHLLHVTGNEVVNYCAVCAGTILGATIMSIVLKKTIEIIAMKLRKA